MLWLHLYDAAGVWIGQFQDADALTSFVAEQGWKINDYEIRTEPSKYPK